MSPQLKFHRKRWFPFGFQEPFTDLVPDPVPLLFYSDLVEHGLSFSCKFLNTPVQFSCFFGRTFPKIIVSDPVELVVHNINVITSHWVTHFLLRLGYDHIYHPSIYSIYYIPTYLPTYLPIHLSTCLSRWNIILLYVHFPYYLICFSVKWWVISLLNTSVLSSFLPFWSPTFELFLL